MSPRWRFLLLALLGAWCGAALELAEIATLRPWAAAFFGRAALEVTALWSLATLALASIVLAIRRDARPAGAFLLAPGAWGIAWLLRAADPTGWTDLRVLALIGVLAASGAVWLQGRAERVAARIALLSRPAPFAALAAALALLAAWQWRATTSRPGPAPAGEERNVLWISLDTLRADRLGCYGSDRGLTPRIDELARAGVVFEDATCPMPLTAPSHTAMLTGLMPHESGVHRNGMPLPRNTPSLPRALSADGWATAAFVSGFPLFQRSSHFADHFHHYDDEFDPGAPLGVGARLSPLGAVALHALRPFLAWSEPLERAGDATVDRVLGWMDRRDPARPFFLFCHLYDVHGAYQPHDPALPRSRFFSSKHALERLHCVEDESERKLLLDLYDGEVRFVDSQVGRLVDRLAAEGLLDTTLVIVTSDHGESLGEHDFWCEHINPYHVETRVPLVLRLPGGEAAGARVRGPAQLTDLMATVRDLLGADFEAPGASLASAIGSGAIPDDRLLLCQSMFDFTNSWYAVSVRNGRYKLFRRSDAFEPLHGHREPGRDSLFDVLADPGETRDLLELGEVPDDVPLDAMRERLAEFERICVSAGPDARDPEVLAMLKRLGYN